jgi:cell division protein FtsB
MRLLLVVLLVLLALIQYPLWWGKGGWFQVWDLQRQVAAQSELNEGLRARNAALDAEVCDLRTGTAAIEERARSDLGMMREGEVFVHISPKNAPALGAQTSPLTPGFELAGPPSQPVPSRVPRLKAPPAAAQTP